MSFSDDVARFVVKAETLERRALVLAANEVFRSVTYGSPITGSQGTPVDTGNAVESWYVRTGDAPALPSARGDLGAQRLLLDTMQPGDTRSIINGAIYTRGLEEGRAKRKPAGWVRLTVAMWPRIVEWSRQQVVRA